MPFFMPKPKATLCKERPPRGTTSSLLTSTLWVHFDEISFYQNEGVTLMSRGRRCIPASREFGVVGMLIDEGV